MHYLYIPVAVKWQIFCFSSMKGIIMQKKIRVFALSATLGLTASVQAHSIWMEPDSEQAVAVRFGEFADGLREASPGMLDNFGNMTAVLVSPKGDKPLEVKKAAQGFMLSGKPGSGESIVVEDQAFPLRKMKVEGKEVAMWYRPAARYIVDAAEQRPRLDLDIVPTGVDGQFNVTFKGQPSSKIEVEVITSSGWVKKVRASEQGLVSFDFPWQGQYVMELTYRDNTPGERALAGSTEKYDFTIYATTLGYVKADGVSAGKSAQ